MPPISADARTLPRLLDPSLSHLRDVTLIPSKTPQRTVRAHRFVLAAASPVLRATLQADPAATRLTLAHADADALDAALQYVYGRVDAINLLPSTSLWTALATCISYSIDRPMHAVQKRILASVTHANVFYQWNMAERYNLLNVQLRCRDIVKNHFVDIVKLPEFLDICPKRLARVLRIHDLIISSEHDVFLALERWLAFDVDARTQHALHLLRLIRLPTIPDTTLLRVCRSPYFGGHNDFYQLLLEAFIRRTEVRIVHAPRIAAIDRRARQPNSRDYLHSLPFAPMGVSDSQLLPSTSLTKSSDWSTKPHKPSVDYNRKEDRTVLFEGHFPLRWYKSVRFRPRSPNSLLFTVVLSDWSLCKRRFVSESRSFLNYKWSLWVDPFSSDPSRMSRSDPSDPQPSDKPSDRDDNNLYVGNTIDTTTKPQSDSSEKPQEENENDYISLYLCCESELGALQPVQARVDFSLFVASATEEYGMERKVCVGRTFKTHGQAMGFRRHIRRNRLQSAAAGLYNRDKDELVVGAHLFAPDVDPTHASAAPLSKISHPSTVDDFSDVPPDPPLEARRRIAHPQDPLPILTTTSSITT